MGCRSTTHRPVAGASLSVSVGVVGVEARASPSGQLVAFASIEASSTPHDALRGITGAAPPWFVAKDVCDALGIATNHLRETLDDDEISNLPITEVGPEFGGRAPLIITEAGLYNLIMSPE